MKKAKIYVCPKCGSADLRASSSWTGDPVGIGRCGNCKYEGSFVIKEEIEKSR